MSTTAGTDPSTARQGWYLGIDFGSSLDNNKARPEILVGSGTLAKASAATALTLVSDAQVGPGRKIVGVWGFIGNTGATAWTDTTATLLKFQDSASTPVVWCNCLKAALLASVYSPVGGPSFTAGAGSLAGGLTTGKGLAVQADANFANGTDLFIKVMVLAVPV